MVTKEISYHQNSMRRCLLTCSQMSTNCFPSSADLSHFCLSVLTSMTPSKWWQTWAWRYVILVRALGPSWGASLQRISRQHAVGHHDTCDLKLSSMRICFFRFMIWTSICVHSFKVFLLSLALSEPAFLSLVSSVSSHHSLIDQKVKSLARQIPTVRGAR